MAARADHKMPTHPQGLLSGDAYAIIADYYVLPGSPPSPCSLWSSGSGFGESSPSFLGGHGC